MNDTAEKLLIPVRECFSLADTLNCGQCFRWQEQDGGWFEGVVERHWCRVRQEEDGIVVEALGGDDWQGDFWEAYFDLAVSYGDFRERLCADERLADAAWFAPGIRILRQEPWEALVSFIISQNNNIGRIRGIVARLCESFGGAIAAGVYAFPLPQALAGLTVEELAPLRSGFRAGYILDAAKQVASGALDLEALRTAPLDEARLALQQIRGVGPKVAECALLYGLGRRECFPMDVWMKRAMTRMFPDGLPSCARGCEGVAQQYLFHYARSSPDFAEKYGAE